MTNLIDRICWGVVGGFVPVAAYVAVSEPMVWRLPQAAPSLVGQAPSRAAPSRPFGDHQLSQGLR